MYRILISIVVAILIAQVLLFALGENNLKKSETAYVVVKKIDSAYQLFRNGEPYYIKGAGGYSHFEELKKSGGNSVRLWSTTGAKEYMDKAHELGLTVMLGLDMGHERQGFNYNDKKAVDEQFEDLKKDILALKDHPALLMWSIGNEVDQFAKNYAVWDKVNDLAKYIHEVDPNHPTTTMLAGVPADHIKEIIKRCPDLDVLSINAFKWIAPVKYDITKAGWTGPYLIGEWGPSGYWESETVPWGTFIEETSSEKAKLCKERYQRAILDNSDRCLGSYIFYWGNKQARTHTLLSLFMENGERTGVLDVMQKEWSGKSPENSAPIIIPISIDDELALKGIYLSPGSNHVAFTDAKDPDNDTLAYFWEIYQESTEKKEGGDKEEKPSRINELTINKNGNQLTFNAPEKVGPYRLFVTVYDGHNNVATANIPFYVKK